MNYVAALVFLMGAFYGTILGMIIMIAFILHFDKKSREK